MQLKYLAAVMLVVAAVVACDRSENKQAASDAVSQSEMDFANVERQWRQQRDDDLRKPDGWTSLIGLHWIGLKAHYVGSAPDNGVRIAIGPAQIGMLSQSDGRWFLTPSKATELSVDDKPVKGRFELLDSTHPQPSIVKFDQGEGQLMMLKRGDRYALRVKHAEAPTRVNFAGGHYWDPDSSWVIKGKWTANPAGQTVPLVDIVGTQLNIPNPGYITFERNGVSYTLQALDEGGDELFIPMADKTSGHDSYGAGRYLYVDRPDASGNVTLNFNRLYNPPCAFSKFATCPLPPIENRIDLAVTAGEKKYRGTL